MPPLSNAPDSILIVDDEPAVLRSMRRLLRAQGYRRVATCEDSREALARVVEHGPSVVLLDLMMPHVGGEEILRELAASHPEIQVVVVTAEQDVRAAVRCMKLGAYDYLVKPVTVEDLLAAVERAIEHGVLRYESARLREVVQGRGAEHRETFDGILTRDPGMERLFGYVEAISRGSHPVLIIGETGTGKELFARALHRASGRKGPFVAVNVAGLDDVVFSDTLFGHRAGAFTGAGGARAGMIEQAEDGTLFLDEIGDLAEASQLKLLRLIQEREYYPLGADTSCSLQARVVAATHRDPSVLRSDLYYRLSAYRVRVPPLRERREDLPLLLDHFLVQAAGDLGKAPPPVDDQLRALLARYDFPGNVRELQGMVFDALARHQEGSLPILPFLEAMGVGDPGEDGRPPAGAVSSPAGDQIDRLRAALRDPGSGQDPIPDEVWRELERENLEAALRGSRGQIAGDGGAAVRLGLKPSTLESRLKALGIDHRTFRD